MYRFTKNYFRLGVFTAIGLSLLFLTWQLGIYYGNIGARNTKRLNSLSRVNSRKSDGNIREHEDLESELEETKNPDEESSSGNEFPQKEMERKNSKFSIKGTPQATNLGVQKGNKSKEEKLKKSTLPETRNLQTKLTTTAWNSVTTTPTTPTTLPSTALVPVTLQYSWSEVYGESDCSPNPWRPILVELFADWVKIAKKHNIEYILFYGSLLGGLRTGDVIPYDSDIDLLMDVKYFPKMKEISDARGFDISDGKIRLVVQPEFDHNVSSTARKRYTCKGKLTPNMVDACSFQEPLGRLVKKYLHIDFYHFYDKGSYLEDPSEEDLKTYKKSDMFPLRPCKFMGFDSFCPNKPWKLLKQYFHSNDLESKYKCKNKQWVDKNGKSAF